MINLGEGGEGGDEVEKFWFFFEMVGVCFLSNNGFVKILC